MGRERVEEVTMAERLESCVQEAYGIDSEDQEALCGALERVCDFLSTPDPEVALGALNHLSQLLEMGEGGSDSPNLYVLALESGRGLDLVEQAQMHDSHAVYQAALNLIERFFAMEG